MVSKGRLFWLKIFGWDCQYCKKEIPELVHLKQELGDSLEIVAIEAQKHKRGVQGVYDEIWN